MDIPLQSKNNKNNQKINKNPLKAQCLALLGEKAVNNKKMCKTHKLLSLN